MCHNSTKHLLTLTLLFGSLSAFAQNSNKENAPYSRFGIGEQRNGLNVVLRGMGSASSGHAGAFDVNTDNPASYASLKLVAYEAAGEGSLRTIIRGNDKIGTGSATLSYFDMGIPIGKHGGIALGVKPQTRVYYATRDTVLLDGIGPTNKIHSGDGSTNYAFVGAAYEFRGFSIGANVGYLFGTIRNSTILQKQYDTVNAYNSDFSQFRKIGGVYYKLGAQYFTQLNKNLALRLGATATLSQQVNETVDNYGIIWRSVTATNVYDTAIQSKDVKGKLTMPLSYSFGAELMGTEKWTVAVDYTAAQWSQYRHSGMEDSVGNAFRLAIGAAFTPGNINAAKYLQRVTYRLGFNLGKDYIRLRGTDLPYYAITAGASFPFRRATDRIHVALEVGKRGTETNGLLRENFIKFALGFSLNDKWFVKRRYD